MNPDWNDWQVTIFLIIFIVILGLLMTYLPWVALMLFIGMVVVAALKGD